MTSRAKDAKRVIEIVAQGIIGALTFLEALEEGTPTFSAVKRAVRSVTRRRVRPPRAARAAEPKPIDVPGYRVDESSARIRRGGR